MSDEPAGIGGNGNGDGDGGVIDWPAVRERLERLAAASAVQELSDDARREILRERAAQLSRVAETAEDDAGQMQVLEFSLASERYAVDTSAVREVYGLKEVTPVPGTPPFIIGVVNVRGRICSVVDLGQVLGAPARDLNEFTMIVVLRYRRMEFAILADAVSGMKTIAASALQTSLPTLTGPRQKYLRGVTPDRVAVLDAQRLLSDEALVVRDERGAAR
jgi:purine-binding chemotaxis protein CheW